MARIVGKGAALYLGATPTKVADLYDVTFDSTGVALQCDVKMDAFSVFSPSHGTAKITAKRRVNTSSVGMFEVFDMANSGELLAFRLDLIDASSSFTQISGEGYITSGSLAAPRGPVDDTFEMTINGAWTTTLPGAN